MLIGEYQHTIDTKKRLALPAKFRKELGAEVIVTRGIEKCLVVYTEDVWKVEAEKLSKLTVSQSEARGFARLILGGAMQISLDSLGRILIPEYLKHYAELKKDVVVCGLSNRLEIWDQESWASYRNETEKKLVQSVEKLGGMGI